MTMDGWGRPQELQIQVIVPFLGSIRTSNGCQATDHMSRTTCTYVLMNSVGLPSKYLACKVKNVIEMNVWDKFPRLDKGCFRFLNDILVFIKRIQFYLFIFHLLRRKEPELSLVAQHNMLLRLFVTQQIPHEENLFASSTFISQYN